MRCSWLYIMNKSKVLGNLAVYEQDWLIDTYEWMVATQSKRGTSRLIQPGEIQVITAKKIPKQRNRSPFVAGISQMKCRLIQKRWTES